MMAAPLLFPDAPHWALIVCFYGGIALAVLLIGSALLVAIRDERRAERRGQQNRMTPLLGMLVCGIGFLAFGAWYFWPSNVPTERPSAVSPGTAIEKIPHLKLQLVLDSITPTGVWFHFEAENIGDMTVTNLTRNFESPGVTAFQSQPPGPITLAPKGTVDLEGAIAPQLLKAQFLTATLFYETQINGKPLPFESQYRFVLPMNPSAHQIIQPAWIKEGPAIAADRNIEQSDAVSFFSKPSGTAAMVLPERKPDGSPNLVVGRAADKTFIADFAKGEIAFTVVFPDGHAKTIYQNVFKPARMHQVTISWNKAKHTVALSVDGVPGHPK
jgi:hypothetical protein